MLILIDRMKQTRARLVQSVTSIESEVPPYEQMRDEYFPGKAKTKENVNVI